MGLGDPVKDRGLRGGKERPSAGVGMGVGAEVTGPCAFRSESPRSLDG